MGMLDGKVGFITGAGHGQGRSHAVRMAKEGADLVLCDICADIAEVLSPQATYDELVETARMVEELDRRVSFGVADVRDRAALTAIVDEGVAKLGRLDVVSANAGIWKPTPFLEIEDDEYRAIVDVCLTGVWNTCKAVVPHMVKQGTGGSIVITSSAAGLRGQVPWAHYTAAKHAVVGLAKSLSNELAKYSIRVNTVHPTGVDTFMGQGGDLETLMMNEPLFIMSASNMMAIDVLQPEDISNAVVFLMSGQAKWITGVQLPVDAGNTNKP
jgi:(+)-trans-carveol dehydrogenase